MRMMKIAWKPFGLQVIFVTGIITKGVHYEPKNI